MADQALPCVATAAAAFAICGAGIALWTAAGRGSVAVTILMLIAYFGYIGLIAFDKAFLATPIGAGKITTVGIPIALGLMVFTIVITGFYVRRANKEFDQLTQQIVEDAQ